MPRIEHSNSIFQKVDKDTVSRRANPYFNILYAYAMYDDVVEYHQGIHMFAVFILNMLEQRKPSEQIGNEEIKTYDEVTAFFLLSLIHI